MTNAAVLRRFIPRTDIEPETKRERIYIVYFLGDYFYTAGKLCDLDIFQKEMSLDVLKCEANIEKVTLVIK